MNAFVSCHRITRTAVITIVMAMFLRSVLFRPSCGGLFGTAQLFPVVCSILAENLHFNSSSSRLLHSSKYAMRKDYYKTLGVNKSATKDDIKKSFRALAMKYHPDLNKDNKSAETKFKEISEAYEVLEDEQKRRQYDAFGHDGVDLSGNGGGMDPNDPFAGFGIDMQHGHENFVHFNMNGNDEKIIFEFLKNMHFVNEEVFQEDHRSGRRRKNRSNDFFEDMGFSVFDMGTVYSSKGGKKKKQQQPKASSASGARKKR